MAGYRTSDPDAHAARLKRRFRSVSRRIEYRSRATMLARYAVMVAVCGAGAYLAMLALSPWPPLTTVRHLASIPNCATARLLDLAPARRGQPGYWPKHDADDDGIACEPIPRWKSRDAAW
jgi:hypothetical protein